MKIAYSHLVQYLEQNPSIEQISDSLFQLGHEHEIDGGIFDMEFTPNRGDCLSINGLLRDLAVFYTVGINQDIFSEKSKRWDCMFTHPTLEIKLVDNTTYPEWNKSLDRYIHMNKDYTMRNLTFSRKGCHLENSKISPLSSRSKERV